MQCVLLGDIIQLMAFILALVELKSVDELAGKQGACIAQSLAEHLAANSMLPLRQKLQQDVPVLLTDAFKSIMVDTEPARPAVVGVTQMPDAAHTAALVKHRLAQKRDALEDYFANASLAKSKPPSPVLWLLLSVTSRMQCECQSVGGHPCFNASFEVVLLHNGSLQHGRDWRRGSSCQQPTA